MKIFTYLFEKFVSLQKWEMGSITGLALLLSFFYTNISSSIIAKIIEAAQKKDENNMYLGFRWFIYASIALCIVYYNYKIIQNSLLSYLTHWIKTELFSFLLKINNENMSNTSFVNFITPISRIAHSASVLLNDILTNLIPTIGFLFVIFGYFFWKKWELGIIFLLSNMVIMGYLVFISSAMFEFKRKQEDMVVENERYLIDNFNNLEKIIYRGEINYEIDEFQERSDECLNLTIKMMNFITNHVFVMNSMVYIIIFACMYYIIILHTKKQMDTFTLITFITILIMYRDNISDTIQSIPANIESYGRIDLISREFNVMIEENTDIHAVMSKITEYKTHELPFDAIEFRNVSFIYSKTTTPILQNYNRHIDLNNKIIGITGMSGNGKSTFVKLIMRLHDCTDGAILIDGVDVKTIDPFYIRRHITYVNQSSKLFDRKITENILYGCKDISKCNANLKEILTYPKIRELYRNVDLDSDAGPLGEKISGGQRQIANIISGLVNPTEILVLDEPTNALDPDLKRELLLILQNFRKHKKCIIIITHDRDVNALFDETIEF